MNKSYFSLILFFFIYLYSGLSFAAAWTQKEGAWQIIGTLSGYSSDRYFDNNSDSKPSGIRFRKLDLNPMVEYGLTDDITLGVNPTIQGWNFKKKDPSTLIYDSRQCGRRIYDPTDLNSTESSYVLSQVEFFARKKVLDRNNLVISVQPSIQSPCVLISANDILYVDNAPDVELRLLGGYGFRLPPKSFNHPITSQNHFVDLEVAYRKRDSIFSDQIKIDGTAGFRFNDKLLIMGQLFSTFSVGDEYVRVAIDNNNILVGAKDNFYSVKAQVSGVRQLTEKTSLQLGFFNEVLGKNSANGGGVFAAIWYSF